LKSAIGGRADIAVAASALCSSIASFVAREAVIGVAQDTVFVLQWMWKRKDLCGPESG
jgi:hypothetical protein